MRSPAEGGAADAGSGRARGRPILELGLRLVALAAIALVLVSLLRSADQPAVERAAGGEIPAALERWSSDPGAAAGHLSFGAAPSVGERQWLRALRGAGMQ